jgi:CCR4-NOT transcription complex subunit 6
LTDIDDLDESSNSSLPLSWLPKDSKGDFSLMTYNILADCLAKPEWYPHVSKANLSWPNRRRKLLRHISRTHPSLICLQEVQSTLKVESSSQANHWLNLQNTLKQNGYSGLYARKPTTYNLDIGCAVFWSSDFECVSKQILNFSSKLESVCAKVNQATIDYFAGGQQVAVYALLRHKKSCKHVLVCSVHISNAWQTPSKQIAQLQSAISVAELLVKTVQTKKGIRDVSIIFAGDFNAHPNSGLYDLAVNGGLPSSHSDAQPNSIEDGKDVSMVKMPFSLGHSLGLSSAYHTVLGTEPEVTNAKPEFNGTLDYIFYQNQKLKVESVLETPKLSECLLQEGLPDDRQASDHIALVSRFSFI